MNSHGIGVGEHFVDSDAPQALMDVRGKEVLKGVGGTAVLGQLNVSAAEVAEHMEPDAIPADVRTFLGDIADLA